MLTSTVKVSAQPGMARRIADLNRNPKTRAVAARHVNAGARRVISIAEDLARSELKERSSDRRRSPGQQRYVDSFFVTEATSDSIGRMQAGFGNSAMTDDGWSLAAILEHGTEGHDIVAKTGGAVSGNLVFPWDPPHTHSQVGGPPGNWPVEFGEGTITSIYAVSHPGTPAYNFFRRARARFRYASRGRR